MARRDALLRLHDRLVAQRDELRRMLGLEIAATDDGKGDFGDIANDDVERELNTQLAALESRELAKIERAIVSIRTGRYGTCESCERKIPVARLNALPYTCLCIECQRNHEQSGRAGGFEEGNWEAAHDFQLRSTDRELTMKDLDIEVRG